MSTEFNPGDVVCLKSGGPSMVVMETIPSSDAEQAPKYACQWFAGNADMWTTLQHETFHSDTLRLVDVPKKKR